MENTLVRNLYRESDKFEGKEIKVSGWVRTIRSSNAFGFIELNDGSFFKNIQIVFESDLENFKEISKFNVSSAITAVGTLRLTPEAKQPFEIKASKVILEGASTSDYPLQKKRHSPEFLRSIAHLRPRSNLFQQYSEFAHLLHMQYTNFFRKEILYMFILQS